MLRVRIRYREEVSSGAFRGVLAAFKSCLPRIIAENLDHGGGALIPTGIECEGVSRLGFNVLPADIVFGFGIPDSLISAEDLDECLVRLDGAIYRIVPASYSFLVEAELLRVAWKEHPTDSTT